MSIHIHRGGTLQTYCGQPLSSAGAVVGWEQARTATCSACTAHFDLRANAEAAVAWLIANTYSDPALPRHCCATYARWGRHGADCPR